MATRPGWFHRYLSLYEGTVMPRSSAFFFPLGVLIWVLAIGTWIWESPDLGRFVVGGVAIPAGIAFGIWSLSVERRAVKARDEGGRTFKDLPLGRRVLVAALILSAVVVGAYFGFQSEMGS